MIVERAMNSQFLSNTYLVTDDETRQAFFIDAGGPVEPLIETASRLGVTPTHVLLTHHHFDHVCELDALRASWPDIEVLIDPLERELIGARTGHGDASIEVIHAGQELHFGAIVVKPLHTPGHTRGMLSFLVSDAREPGEGSSAWTASAAGVFTGDTLFKGSVGGVRAPGHTTYIDLKDSIMGTLMELGSQTTIYPGHAEATTVQAEWESNRFIRIWRGLDPEGSSPCVALGEPATLILLGEDYDGGKKAWVRWRDGSDDIVPGSRVLSSQ
jgi:hydroxyacylglutathione hydrolase